MVDVALSAAEHAALEAVQVAARACWEKAGRDIAVKASPGALALASHAARVRWVARVSEMEPNDENDAFFYDAPLVPLAELGERLDVVELCCVQLAANGPLAHSLMRRAQQARHALDACAARSFGTNLRRALAVKIYDLEMEARAALRAARRTTFF